MKASQLIGLIVDFIDKEGDLDVLCQNGYPESEPSDITAIQVRPATARPGPSDGRDWLEITTE